ncbi:AMP-binding protein [Xanthomonas sp. MUS 060]|uniref:AMP-binding protein n=1 Tax=Xanthomonas sp. MUS 060 TaxID=1588031 RepID=UPI001F3C5B21|nr:AMP-binding protein [Xanthomonas sp. MUS 060]
MADGAEDLAVDRLPLLDKVERHQLLMEWNATAADYPRDAGVHELFEAQVAREPSAIAIAHGELALTYDELNTRANQLAHYLRKLGVRPDDRVAICMQRSIEMVVALLAVLKAGAAYVPLDPAYPPERLAYILADCGAVMVLAVTDAILPAPLELLRVNVDDTAVNAAQSDSPGLRSHGGKSAYVMYGSWVCARMIVWRSACSAVSKWWWRCWRYSRQERRMFRWIRPIHLSGWPTSSPIAVP